MIQPTTLHYLCDSPRGRGRFEVITACCKGQFPHQQKKLCFIIKEHAKVSKDLRYVQIPNLAKRFLTRDFVTRVSGKLAPIVTLR